MKKHGFALRFREYSFAKKNKISAAKYTPASPAETTNTGISPTNSANEGKTRDKKERTISAAANPANTRKRIFSAFAAGTGSLSVRR